MAYSYVRYTGNGSTSNYTFAFPYIDSSHIKVRLDGVLTSAFSFLNSSTVHMNTPVPNGTIIEIRRETPKDQPIVNFQDGSVLLERDLDLLATYDLYLAQESDDLVNASITQNSLGQWDAKSVRIINVADPVNAQDAVTKGYVDTGVVAVMQPYATAAAASAASADASKTAAQSAQSAAESARDATLAAYDSFDDRYLGAKSSDPTVDNDGNPLVGGSLYFNTVYGTMRIYTGSAWTAAYVSGTDYYTKAEADALLAAKASTTSLTSGLAGKENVDANIVRKNAATGYTAQHYAVEATLTDAATVAWDVSAAQVAKVTLGGNRTFGAPTNQVAGAFYGLLVIQDGTGSRTGAWNSVFKFPTATAPTLTTTANAKDFFVFRSDGTNMYLVGKSMDVR